MLNENEFGKIIKEGAFELSPEGDLVDPTAVADNPVQDSLLSLVDTFKAKHESFRKGYAAEFLGKIVDAIESSDVDTLKKMAGMLNKKETETNNPAVRDLAGAVRQIVAVLKGTLGEDIVSALNMLAESLERKLIVD